VDRHHLPAAPQLDFDGFADAAGGEAVAEIISPYKGNSVQADNHIPFFNHGIFRRTALDAPRK